MMLTSGGGDMSAGPVAAFDAGTIGLPAASQRRWAQGLWLAALVAAALGFSVHTVHSVDARLRLDLLNQARLVANALDIQDIRQLSFTAHDHDHPAFLRLRSKMIELSDASNLRCIYSQRLVDGKVLFGPESIPEDDPLASPPGTPYLEPPSPLLQSFETGREVTVGPFTDEYGTFVSAFVPVVDTASRQVLLVVGVDIDASDWHGDVATRSALPVGMTLILVVVIASMMAATSRARASRKPVMRLMPPLALTMILLVTMFGLALWGQYRSGVRHMITRSAQEVPGKMRHIVDLQSAGLATALKLIAANPTVADALVQRDVDRLAHEYRELFARLQQQHEVTHFYFMDAQRTCLLRLHRPEARGDTIDRFTVREAQRTGFTTSGIELGVMGTFTLRVVEPVIQYDTVVGYVELGKEIGDILEMTRDASNSHLAVLVHKEQIQRPQWEKAMLQMGLEPDWDRFGTQAMIYCTLQRLPQAIDRELTRMDKGPRFSSAIIHDEIGRAWHVAYLPMNDASGRQVADLIAMRDISPEMRKQVRLGLLSIMAIAVTLTVLFGFLFAMLRRTDRSIVAQQQELEAQRRSLANVLEGTNAGMWEWVIPTGQTTFNERWAQIIGYSLAELSPLSIQTWQAMCHPDDLGRSGEALNRYFAGKTDAYVCECRMKHKDGRWVWVMDRGKVVEWTPDGHPLRMAGTHMDINAAKLAEQAMEEQRRFLRLVIDLVPSLIVVKDRDSRFLLANQAAANTFGASVSEVEGQRDSDFSPTPEQVQRYRRDDLEVMQSRTTKYILEEPIHQANGSTSWLSTVKVPLLNEQGDCTGLLAVATDITARKKMQDELLALNQQLADSSKKANQLAHEANAASIAKSEFLANMSHEIRTPMTAILGFAELLAEDVRQPLPSAERAEYIRTIQRNGEHLLAIINDILDLSKIEAGKMTVECVCTDVAQTLHDVISNMQVKASAKGLSLRMALEQPIPRTIQSDPLRLRQILMNLVGNAIKFTEMGSVTLTPWLDRRGPLPMLRVRITDTGIGMTQEQMGRLFGAFEQADASTTRKYGGTGLGLRISKRLAHMLGGDLTATSAPGQGTEFCLSVMAGQPSDGNLDQGQLSSLGCVSESSSPAEDLSLAGMRILLAEDGPDNLRLLTFRLRQSGASVHTATTGREALELLTVDHTAHGPLLEPCPVDLLLTDMQMPEMDGYQLARRLRDMGSQLPIIALTAHSMAGDEERCLQAGCNAYASKPIDTRVLLSVCSQWGRQENAPATPPPSAPAADAAVAQAAAPSGQATLLSELANDPDMLPLVEEFLGALPQRMAELEHLVNTLNMTELTRFAHQLKGAAGGYGFPTITEAARSLEQQAKQGQDLAALSRSVGALIDLIHAACPSARPSPPTGALPPKTATA